MVDASLVRVVVEEQPLPPGLVVVEDLTYAYPPPSAGADPVRALDGISFGVKPGEMLGILGTGGSGKSTLCLALNGIVPQRTGGTFGGRVLVGGWDTRRRPVAELATRVAIVFQEPEGNFVGLAVEDEVAFGPENLGLPRPDIAERVAWALDRVGMTAHRDASPARLSGGQKQRVAIAAALAMRPAVLVLDEPTATLDPVGAAEIAHALTALKAAGNTTVVLVSQDADLLAAHADRLLLLDAGRVVTAGPPREVFADDRMPELGRLGLAIPTLPAVAAGINDRLDTAFAFLTPEEAAAALSAPLAHAPDAVDAHSACSIHDRAAT